jgi:hypothetical protein
VFIMAVADGINERSRERIDGAFIHSGGRGPNTCYPAGRGQEQYGWEPPRTVGDSDEPRSQGTLPKMEPREPREGNPQFTARPSPRGDIQRQIEQSLGRNFDGTARRVDYAELCLSVDNRTDELRLLGNGVVPATAERAFRLLWENLS